MRDQFLFLSFFETSNNNYKTRRQKMLYISLLGNSFLEIDKNVNLIVNCTDIKSRGVGIGGGL